MSLPAYSSVWTSNYRIIKPTKRPELKKGDLVRKKDDKNGTGYIVVRILGNRSSTDGYTDVMIKNKSLRSFVCKRRALWRVPNQPGEKTERPSAYVSRHQHEQQQISPAQPPFKVGDKVKLKTGVSIYTVVDIRHIKNDGYWADIRSHYGVIYTHNVNLLELVTAPFKVGDKVKLKTGVSIYTVIDVDGNCAKLKTESGSVYTHNTNKLELIGSK